MPAEISVAQTRRHSLSDSIQVRGRFTRSVHLERDFKDAASHSEYYTVASTVQALRAVEEALARPAGRAITLTGPYGSGKSAFCVQLARRLSIPAPSDGLLTVSVGLLPVLRVGSRQPLGATLVDALFESLEAHQSVSGEKSILQELKQTVPEAFTSEGATPRAIGTLFARAAAALPGGLLLVIDELGKFLEFAALHPAQSDPFVLQELAEAAARSAPDKPLLVVTVLHQNMEAYARTLTRSQQAEWQKVSERFRHVSFFPSDRERVEMVGQAIKRRSGVQQSDQIGKSVKAICSDYARLELPPLASEADWETWAQKAYPLHPLTLLALPTLFRRVGQSHRSLFTFLSAEEPHALGQFLRDASFDSHGDGGLPFYGLNRLFDYGSHVLAPSAGGGGFSRAWADAQEAVEAARRSLPEETVRVLKAIALLGVLHDARLPASDALLRIAFPNVDVTEALARLQESRHIVYRRRLGVFHVWEGGDVDVEAALQTARLQQSSHRASFQVGETLVKSDFLMARRHSYRTGTLRLAQQNVCSASELAQALAAADQRLHVVLCLAANAAERAVAQETLQQANSVPKPHVLVLLAQETELLREAALDILAAKQVAEQVRELAGDKAARRELSFRAADAQNQFVAEWQRLFVPADATSANQNAENVAFYYKGAKLNSCDLIPFLSQMADDLYAAAPSLKNEIINRRVLSAAGVAARRNLVEALLDPARVRLEHLGIKGYPPERSIYECLLKTTGLHRWDAVRGEYVLAAPDPGNDPANLFTAWVTLEQALLSPSSSDPIPVGNLMSYFSAPPYGLTEGVFPILLCVLLRIHDNETTFYREGTFVPEPGISDWEMLMRRPQDFAVNGCRVEGTRQVIVERLSQSLGTEATVVCVVRALLKMTRTLPDYAKKTRRVSPLVRTLRQSLERAQSPEALLFDELPTALGVNGLLEGEFFDTLNNALREWSATYPAVVAHSRDRLLEACGLAQGKIGWEDLQREARRLEAHLGFAPARLVPFVRRAALPGDVDTSIETVLAQVADRPPRTWDDAAADRFETDALVLGEQFRQLIAEAGSFADPVLVPQEAARSQSVANTLRDHFPADAAPRVLRAALLALLRDLPNEPEEDLGNAEKQVLNQIL